MGPLASLVLAAGSGSRFGGGKLTAPFGDGVLLDGALAAAFAAPVDRVVVVTGAQAEAVGAAAEAYTARTRPSRPLALVQARDHARGLSASLGAGLRALPHETGGVFIFLGDMPQVPHAMAEHLAAAISDRLAAAPVLAGRRGHPVLIARALFSRLLALDGDRGAGALLADLGDLAVLVETDDPGVLFDVDRPGDLLGGR